MTVRRILAICIVTGIAALAVAGLRFHPQPHDGRTHRACSHDRRSGRGDTGSPGNPDHRYRLSIL